MVFNPKQYFKNYFKRKSKFSIVTDFIFILLIVLLIIPGTRTEVSAFFIKMTSFPPSTLDIDEQFSISEDAKNWELYDLKGNKFSFDELNSKPIFLNVWATWCPPCVAELPSINELHAKYADDVNFILLSSEDVAKVNAFLDKNDYHDLNIYISNTIPPDFATQSIPATFVITKQGKVVINKKGAARWNSTKMNNLLDSLI